jgi:hypothetical protein
MTRAREDGGPIAIAEAISGGSGKERQLVRSQPRLAEAICALFRQSISTRRGCRAFPLEVGAKGGWTDRLYSREIHIAIVSKRDTQTAWEDRRGPARPLRSLFAVSQDKVLVSSTTVADDLVREVMAAIFDNLYRLQSLYAPSAKLDPDRRKDWIERGQDIPLHPGAWQVYQERGWLPNPFWVVLGSFDSRDRALRLAQLLGKKYREGFDQGLQVRYSNNRLFTVIDGGLRTRTDGRRRIEKLRGIVPSIKDAYLYPGLRGWGPSLLR